MRIIRLIDVKPGDRLLWPGPDGAYGDILNVCHVEVGREYVFVEAGSKYVKGSGEREVEVQ